MQGTARPATTRSTSAQDLGALPVSAVMVCDVPVVDGHDPLVEVWQRLQDLDSPVAAVCDGTRVVAVVSPLTLAMWWPSGGPCEMRRHQVRDVIDPGIPTVHPHATVQEAAELINNFGLEGLPVVAAGGALLGVVTPRELVRLLAGEHQMTIPPRRDTAAKGQDQPAECE